MLRWYNLVIIYVDDMFETWTVRTDVNDNIFDGGTYIRTNAAYLSVLNMSILNYNKSDITDVLIYSIFLDQWYIFLMLILYLNIYIIILNTMIL